MLVKYSTGDERAYTFVRVDSFLKALTPLRIVRSAVATSRIIINVVKRTSGRTYEMRPDAGREGDGGGWGTARGYSISCMAVVV